MANSQTFLRRLNAHLKAAQAYAELSHAKRLKVGAVLLKDDRIISVGYNGMPSGMDNECEYLVDMLGPKGEHLHELQTRPEVCHAEMNVIAFAAKHGGIGTDGCTMVVTHSPCFECSKLLMQAGVKEIYYEKEYRLTDSIDFLKSNNIIVLEIPNDESKKTRSTTTSQK